MPELPSAKRARYLALGLPTYDVLILVGYVCPVATLRSFATSRTLVQVSERGQEPMSLRLHACADSASLMTTRRSSNTYHSLDPRAGVHA